MTTKDKNETLIERLQELVDGGLSKTEMARIAGVSKQAVTGWFKTGTMSKASAVALSEAAGVSLAWLFGEEVENPTELRPDERKLLILYNQLPRIEQENMIEAFSHRLKELDAWVDQYIKMRDKNKIS
ncbi:TPA: helix-turn-helix domain-containing protein [Enterobacter roggenkampii]|nr:helix-turn-helix domain-containing protein [Enterobacter roggenkampii]